MAALNGEEEEPPPEELGINADQVFELAVAMVGGLAIVLGLIGFAKKESLRVAGSAELLGASALAFQFIVVIFLVFVAIIFIATLSDAIGAT